MTRATDDDPEQCRIPEVLSLEQTSLPAFSAGEVPLNPARAYLLSLNSPRSRQTMASLLGIVARMLGAVNTDTCSWGSLRRHHVMAITELLRDSGLTTASVNNYL